MLKKLFGSKKFLGLLIGLVVEVIAASGLMALDCDTKVALMTAVGGLTGTYLLGQGIADHGKEKAKVEKGEEQ